jgi:hypothetical protein
VNLRSRVRQIVARLDRIKPAWGTRDDVLALLQAFVVMHRSTFPGPVDVPLPDDELRESVQHLAAGHGLVLSDDELTEILEVQHA